MAFVLLSLGSQTMGPRAQAGISCSWHAYANGLDSMSLGAFCLPLPSSRVKLRGVLPHLPVAAHGT